jgi:hypothetical protein
MELAILDASSLQNLFEQTCEIIDNFDSGWSKCTFTLLAKLLNMVIPFGRQENIGIAPRFLVIFI